MSFFKRHPLPDDGDTDEERDQDGTIDPNLRLRTVRTAASTIAESIRSEQRAQRRKAKSTRRKFFRKPSVAGEKKKALSQDQESTAPSTTTSIVGPRRRIYVNQQPLPHELDSNGDLNVKYVRNKVRTTKYTILTFLPKNLYEQFRRVANLYFLALVIIQVFPIFGAAAAQISMLPLLFILTVTAIKDGVEDYGRAVLDEEVNTSAATKLGDWRNVNIPRDPRSFLQKALGLNKPGRVTKGVRRLRSREAGEWGKIVLQKKSGDGEDDGDAYSVLHPGDGSSVTLAGASQSRTKLEDIQSVDSHSYPPSSGPTHSLAGVDDMGTLDARLRSGSLTSTRTHLAPSMRSRASFGVVDYAKPSRGTARWERTLWKKLEVGDIVLLRENDQVPADIVVLSTSDSDGLCYLETKNLDGETNLKPRKSLRATSSISAEEDVEHASFVLESEPPHQNLYLYNGVLTYTSRSPSGGGSEDETKQEPVSINELLLRGCSLRNTSWVIGLVAFTGADTKIMLNGGSTPSKRSKIEKETNFNVIMNFIVLLAMCVATAVASGVYEGMSNTSADFFEEGSDPSKSHAINSIITFASCLIAFQNIVPISLYISIEIVKTIQAYFISQDIDMYYSPYDTNCVPKTWNISDDLGQIEYVFSDKTGTLTQNVMEFQKCSIHGVKYGEGITEAQRGAAMRRGEKEALDPQQQAEALARLKEDMMQKMTRAFKNRWAQPDKLTLVSSQLMDDLTSQSAQRTHIIAFFRALAICHSVLADKPDPRGDPFHLEYKAESPDEAALVAAAREVGFPFVGRSHGALDIEVMGQPERYTPLRVLEFNSTRKRMSVIVRNADGRLVLYTKGADSVIYERLAANHDKELKERTARDMEDFANGGLRTLCVAYRYLSEEEYFDWSRVYDAAANALSEREEEIDKANEAIERELTILGATALEDKLQEGVPEAIEMLHKAGIKLWILTGDKLQTAIEIGFSCNLLKSDMDVMIISAGSPEEARSKIEAGLNKIASILGPPSWDPKKRGFIPGLQASFAVVIDGDTLRYALEPELKPMFLNLATQCETVVCCRVSPAQKALTVQLVKEGRNAMTLSIGDGANDVAMIQEANIGCGLFGLEGSQAAMSADYAFGQFRYLTKLLLVHGRWSYMRIADMHANFFYKNVIWTLAMFWFLFYNSFDATYLYQYTFILLYNLVFTSLPVIVMGAFDQDLNAKAALAFPQLYIRGIRGLEYTRTKFWLYMADGLYQSAIVFFIPFLIWQLGLAVAWNGKGIDSLADFGTTIAVAAIFTANIYVGISTHYWTVITWVVIVGSSLVMVIWVAVYSLFDSVDFNDEVIVLYGEVTFWAAVLLTCSLALAPRFLVKFISSTFLPLDRDIVREMWVLGDLKSQLGIKHRKERKRNQADLERAPMYQQPHARTISEVSNSQPDYEPALTRSPNDSDNLSPPQSVGFALSPPLESEYQDPTVRPRDSQYLVAPDPYDRTSPNTGMAIAGSPASPHPSYYSASDIPIPSPMPSPRYSYYPPSERVTSTAILTPVTSERELPLSPQPVHALSVDPSPSPRAMEMNSYEMRVRSPPSAFPSNHLRANSRAQSRASEASHYMTASEGDHGELEDEDDVNGRPNSQYSYTGPMAI
ncbi:phospholipid-translocating P-type ATPase [Rickenella mellea]|uniref:Phospholipid-transporting ATPase n=1 Tax=Rickenella mellea TaxID=50990 RepID=A0A4Y7PKY1_9AGAM|nr:phospholipid-translocating P-type ATPase [Rickenella mellea]